MENRILNRAVLSAFIFTGYFLSVFASAGETLGTVAEIRSLSREDAAKGLPLVVRGTVVYKARGGRSFILHDGHEGISVHLFRAKELGIWAGGHPPESETDVGAVIEIEGITGPAGYSPVIVPTRFHRVGTGALPEPLKLSMEHLLSGSYVTQRVAVEGVVQGSTAVDDGKWNMKLMVEGHPCEVDFQRADGFDSKETLDARVRISGFCSPVFNLRSEFTGLRLLAWGKGDMTVITPPPADPFAAPRRPLNGLLLYSKTSDRFQRKVTAGTVNFVRPGRFFFLQDGNTGLLVESADTEVAVGDRLEVAGFVENTRGIASIGQAITRKTGRALPPAPVPVTAKELLLPETSGQVEPVVASDHFGCLVEIRGHLRQIERRSAESLWSMLVESDGEVFRAQLPSSLVNYKPPWEVGSELMIRGVCDLEFTPRKPGTNSPLVSGFNLWLGKPGDVTILKGPPWWSPQRLAMALSAMVAVLALVLVWNLLLRRKVEKQMAVISSKLRSETLHAERNRLARDLHDTLEQQLVGVALQLDDAEHMIGHDPQAAEEVVALACRMLRHTRAEARRSVWDLRSEVLESQGLGNALKSMVEGVASPSGPTVELSLGAACPSLSLDTQFQIFRIAQEALANALKHAAATRITISLDSDLKGSQLVIADDGHGFASGTLARSDGSHFGILGMHERADRIGAKLTISCNPSGGTTVTLSLPHNLFATGEAKFS